MSIDLKAHGLRVKPLEWEPVCSRLYRAKNYLLHAIDSGCTVWRASYRVDGIYKWLNFASSSFAAASEVCKQHHESQVLALLEQVEGGQ